MRSPAKITATALLILATTITYIPVAEGANYYPAETKFWVDCSSGFRTTDCIESVEYSDPASEKRDANGFLDYTSIVWKKATTVPNSRFKYKEIPDQSIPTRDQVPELCSRAHAINEFLHDVCYVAKGLTSDGTDIIFRLMVDGNGEAFGVYQWVEQGIARNWNREDGWVAQTVPDGSTWRITVKSDSLAKDTGVVTSNMKNPNINITKGSDGISRTTILGSVYPNQFGCVVPGKLFDPRGDLIDCQHPESYAQTASQGLNISVTPYNYQFEKLKGYAPGGIFVSGSTNSLGQVQYDQEQGIITVPMKGPHYLFDRKTLNKGWMEVAVKGEVIRKAFNLDPAQAGNIVKVEISESENKTEIATYTSRYEKALDVFEIRAYNFGFSSPTLRVKLKPIANQTANASNSGNPSAAAPQGKRMSTIMCVKGKDSRRITAFNPKCPKGWRKK